MFRVPGRHYSDPEFSWKFEVAPAGIGFMNGRGIGPQYDGDLFVGAARPFLEGGFLWHFKLTGNRRRIAVDDPRLADRVADNTAKPSPTDPVANAMSLIESESLLFGRNFGVGTDIRTGPNGNLFVVSLSDGAVYEIFRRSAAGRAAAQKAAAAAKRPALLSSEGLPIASVRSVQSSVSSTPTAPAPLASSPVIVNPLTIRPAAVSVGSEVATAPATDIGLMDWFRTDEL